MGYDHWPCIFKGRALYQLQLVKSEEARKYVPDELKLVELFGYTLGGFYLARYSDSPVGAFDELVTLGGLVWNAPTSCAWAARVYVNNREARDHGLRHVGLPSRLATFAEDLSVSNHQHSKKAIDSWWRQPHVLQPTSQGATTFSTASQAPASKVSASSTGTGGQVPTPAADHPVVIRNVERARGRSLQTAVGTFFLPHARRSGEFAGPRITMALPSFSGSTLECPELLKYACDLKTSVRLVPAVKVVVEKEDNLTGESMANIIGGKPLVVIAFDDMVMTVEKPQKVELSARKSSKQPAIAGASSAGKAALLPFWFV